MVCYDELTALDFVWSIMYQKAVFVSKDVTARTSIWTAVQSTSHRTASCGPVSITTDQVRKLDVRKETGPDATGFRMLREGEDQLSDVVKYIFNLFRESPGTMELLCGASPQNSPGNQATSDPSPWRCSPQQLTGLNRQNRADCSCWGDWAAWVCARATSALGCPLNSTEEGANRGMLAKVTSIMVGPSHPCSTRL